MQACAADHDLIYFTTPKQFKDWVRDTLRLVVYRQSVRLGAEPLVAHDQSFFFFLQLNPYVIVLM
jgi:hypothetical protein